MPHGFMLTSVSRCWSATRDMHTSLQNRVLGRMPLSFRSHLLPLLPQSHPDFRFFTPFFGFGTCSALLPVITRALFCCFPCVASGTPAAPPLFDCSPERLLPCCPAFRRMSASLCSWVPTCNQWLALICADYVAQDFRCHCGSLTQYRCTDEVRPTAASFSLCIVRRAESLAAPVHVSRRRPCLVNLILGVVFNTGSPPVDTGNFFSLLTQTQMVILSHT